MNKLIPDCRLVTMPVGHRVHLTTPDPFAELVLPFLAGEPDRKDDDSLLGTT